MTQAIPPPLLAYRRRRQQRMWVRRGLLGVALAIILGTGLVALVLIRSDSHTSLTLDLRVDGRSRRVVVHRLPATVETVLAEAKVQPSDGRLLAIKSGRVLDAHRNPARLLLDGRPVDLRTPVAQAQTLEVVPGKDTTEGTVQKENPMAPPPLPRIERYLWHPGSPGTSADLVGAVSGEVLSSTQVTPPSSPAQETGKVVALTFDDGPWPDTPAFLEVLKAKKVKATFCTIGDQVLQRADMIRAIDAAGMSMCNHTKTHDERLDREPLDRVQFELDGGIAPLVQVLGRPPSLYRPPGGALNDAIIDAAHQRGERVIGWAVDPADYKKPGTGQIVGRVLSQVHPGAIILMHDGGGDRSQTLSALPTIIDRLSAQGYSFATPDALAPVPAGAPTAAPPPQAGAPEPSLGPEGEGTTSSVTSAGSPPTSTSSPKPANPTPSTPTGSTPPSTPPRKP